MNIIERTKNNAKILIPLGMLFLAASIAWPHYIGSTPHMSDARIDGFRGFLMGIAIGLEMIAIRAISRRRRA